MGRKKKIIPQPTKEAMEYAEEAASRYAEMRDFCKVFESSYPSLFRKGQVNKEAFEDLESLSESTFIVPKLASVDIDKMDDYLSKREKVYLFEYSMERLDEAVRPVADSLFVDRESWESVMKKHCVSRMTVSRYRKTALLSMAEVVDSYMMWKAQSLFM